MTQFTRSHKRIILAVGLGLYVVAMGAVIVWLVVNADETVRRRLDQTPVVTVYVPGAEPVADAASVPSSWQEKEAVQPQAMPEVIPVDEKAVDVPAEADAAPVETIEQEAPPVATEVTEPQEPVAAVETPQAEPQQVEAPQTSARWQKYARAFDRADNRPRIAIVMVDLGLSESVTQAAITELPADVSLSFSAAAGDLESWVNKARAAGHETLLAVPMEPVDYPYNDPGPHTLLTGLDDAENVERLRRALSRAEGYVGVMPAMGQKFVTFEQKLVPVMDTIHQQEVIVFDATLNNKSLIAPLARLGRIPFTRADAALDVSNQSLDDQLAAIEKTATDLGQAVVIATPYPVTFAALKKWIAGLDKKGFVLAPITATLSEAP